MASFMVSGVLLLLLGDRKAAALFTPTHFVARFFELFQLENQLNAQLTPASEQTPDGEITLAGEDGTIYTPGPVALSGTAVEGATAGLNNGGQWTVNPSFKGGENGIVIFAGLSLLSHMLLRKWHESALKQER